MSSLNNMILKKYFSNIASKNKSALDLNDDVFFDKKKGLVISVDTYNEGSHFLNFKKPNLVIKKIIRSSISDLICKGVKPKFYFISGSGNNVSFSKKPSNQNGSHLFHNRVFKNEPPDDGRWTPSWTTPRECETSSWKQFLFVTVPITTSSWEPCLLEHACSRLGICLEYDWNKLRVCLEYASVEYCICLEQAWPMFGIFSE